MINSSREFFSSFIVFFSCVIFVWVFLKIVSIYLLIFSFCTCIIFLILFSYPSVFSFNSLSMYMTSFCLLVFFCFVFARQLIDLFVFMVGFWSFGVFVCLFVYLWLSHVSLFLCNFCWTLGIWKTTTSPVFACLLCTGKDHQSTWLEILVPLKPFLILIPLAPASRTSALASVFSGF